MGSTDIHSAARGSKGNAYSLTVIENHKTEILNGSPRQELELSTFFCTNEIKSMVSRTPNIKHILYGNTKAVTKDVQAS